jgi:hypothetical protein
LVKNNRSRIQKLSLFEKKIKSKYQNTKGLEKVVLEGKVVCLFCLLALSCIGIVGTHSERVLELENQKLAE